MICIAGNLPVLQVGRYQVTGYHTRWIHQAITEAATRSGQEDFAFIDDVYEGVIHYLKNKCPLRLLKLEDLYDRVAHMLNRIGYASIANALQPLAPPVTISLERAAKDAGEGFELAFFNELQLELSQLKQVGANEIFFCHLEECIRILTQKQEWTRECENLEADILDWLQKVGTSPERQGHRIRASLYSFRAA